MRLLCGDFALGASGDMLLGALLGLGAPVDALAALGRDWLQAELRVLPPGAEHPAWRVRLVDDRHDHHHHGLHPHEMRERLAQAPVSNSVRATALRLLDRLVAAEAQAHNVPPDKVHFHELGNLDTLLDLAGVPLLLEQLRLDALYGSPLEVGRGTVSTAHGLLAVPAPATRHLLGPYPVTMRLDGERCTPTGAVLVTELFAPAPPPPGRLLATGSGQGERPYDPVSRVTLHLLEAATTETLWQLETNLDDCDPRLVADTADRLRNAGAKDAWLVPLTMKKGRAGQQLTVLTDGAHRATCEDLVLRALPAFGIRAFPVERRLADSRVQEAVTPYGQVRVRVSRDPDGSIIHATPEYADCRTRADAHGVTTATVDAAARATVAAGSR